MIRSTELSGSFLISATHSPLMIVFTANSKETPPNTRFRTMLTQNTTRVNKSLLLVNFSLLVFLTFSPLLPLCRLGRAETRPACRGRHVGPKRAKEKVVPLWNDLNVELFNDYPCRNPTLQRLPCTKSIFSNDYHFATVWKYAIVREYGKANDIFNEARLFREPFSFRPPPPDSPNTLISKASAPYDIVSIPPV